MSEEQTGGENLNESTAEKTTEKPKAKRKGNGLVAIIVIALIVGAVALFTNLGKGEAVATVDGKTITKGEYQKQLKVTEKWWQVSYGNEEGAPPVSSAEVQEYIRVVAMDSLINDVLIQDAAREAGIVVSDEDVEATYQEIHNFYPTEKEFRAALKEDGLDEAGLRDNIRKELTLTRFIEGAVPVEDLTASEAELREIYSLNFPETEEGEEEAMSFEDFSELARPQVEVRKFQEAYLVVIESLRENADYEILIDLLDLEDQEIDTDMGIPETEDVLEEVTTSSEGATTTATSGSESELVENDSVEEDPAE